MSSVSKASKFTGYFFIFAGINHFILPSFYLPLIPEYLPYPSALNFISGALEILFGIFLCFPKTQKWGALGVMLLMVLFIPSHWYFIQMGSCVPYGLCVPPWLAWTRLLVVHPILIWWGYRLYQKG